MTTKKNWIRCLLVVFVIVSSIIFIYSIFNKQKIVTSEKNPYIKNTNENTKIEEEDDEEFSPTLTFIDGEETEIDEDSNFGKFHHDEIDFDELEDTCVFREFNKQVHGKLKKKSIPRKIFQFILCSIETPLLKLRMSEFHDLVDYFVILEGNISNSYMDKPLFVKPYLSELSGYRDQFTYIQISGKPKGKGFENEDFLLNTLMKEGIEIARELGAGDDDLVFIHHADEIQQRDFLKILKYYEGFETKEIAMSFKWNLYNFAFSNRKVMKFTRCIGGNMKHYGGLQQQKTSREELFSKHVFNCQNRKFSDIRVFDNCYMGWHCTWCFEVEKHQLKAKYMTSSYLRDDYGHIFSDLNTVKEYVDNGIWFASESKASKPYLNPLEWTKDDAPICVLRDPETWEYLYSKKFTKEHPNDWKDLVLKKEI